MTPLSVPGAVRNALAAAGEKQAFAERVLHHYDAATLLGILTVLSSPEGADVLVPAAESLSRVGLSTDEADRIIGRALLLLWQSPLSQPESADVERLALQYCRAELGAEASIRMYRGSQVGGAPSP